ncbi:unnamed protein product [Paramecium pentaurelia]|uniref:Uncharacterized protein n=1 Tax=Paramecium pentaurelia TaxID=43138 RepID=A0A8S1RXV8_9CILI|nr:unnamed protein product [Paramecium pentaurelia]
MSEILFEIIEKLDQEEYTNQLQIIREFNHIIHLKVYQQHVYNFCGYHATYNILQLLNYFHQKKCYIYHSVSFWKYVKSVQNYLKLYRTKHNINHEPWSNYDIEHGDFERCYLKPWKELYHNIIVIQYQFGRVVNSLKEKEQIAQSIQEFINYQQETPLIQAYMLGITFHWVSFVAVKTKTQTKFYFMDSKNIDYCEWGVNQIQEYLNDINNQRIKIGRIPYKPYELDMYLQGILDLQGLIKLMVQILRGELNFNEYLSDSSTLMYVQPLYELLGMSEQQFLNANPQEIDENIITMWAQEYKHTIFSVLKDVSVHYEKSRKLLTQVNKITSNIHSRIGQQEVHNPFQQCHDVIQGLVESFKYLWSYFPKEKQINLYFNDSTNCQHISYITYVMKAYFREFVTKQHHYHIRIQFYENIFHPQGGGQPDDVGSIIIGDKEFLIKNMYNDRQHQESYVDIEFSQEAYDLLLDCRTNKTPILQKVNRDIRVIHSQLHSAGHLLQEELVKLGKGLKYIKGMHFQKESYVQLEGEFELPIEQIPRKFEFENLQLSINYYTHNQVFEILGYIPEFVEFSDMVRWIKLRNQDVGFPCYGTHTVEGLHTIQISNILKNNNIFTIFYNL